MTATLQRTTHHRLQHLLHDDLFLLGFLRLVRLHLHLQRDRLVLLSGLLGSLSGSLLLRLLSLLRSPRLLLSALVATICLLLSLAAALATLARAVAVVNDKTLHLLRLGQIQVRLAEVTNVVLRTLRSPVAHLRNTSERSRSSDHDLIVLLFPLPIDTVPTQRLALRTRDLSLLHLLAVHEELHRGHLLVTAVHHCRNVLPRIRGHHYGQRATPLLRDASVNILPTVVSNTT